MDNLVREPSPQPATTVCRLALDAAQTTILVTNSPGMAVNQDQAN